MPSANPNAFSPALKDYLKRQDAGHMPLYSGANTYFEVIQQANKYGLRVRALDCTASYHVKGANTEARNQMFSYFASRVIDADQAAHGPHKWVAFIGSAHTNTNLQVPGLAELQGAASLHIRDAAPNLASPIRPGRWETGLETRWTALRSDFTLKVGVAGMREPAAFVPLDRARLKVFRTLSGRTPVNGRKQPAAQNPAAAKSSRPRSRSNDQGLFYIDRWGMAQQRFLYQTPP